MAVTPQEGWFVVGETTYSGKDYWIINNTNNLNFNRFNLHSVGGTEYESNGNSYDGVFFTQYYRGSSFLDWYVDEDWYIDFGELNRSYTTVLFDYYHFPNIQTYFNDSANNISGDIQYNNVPFLLYGGLNSIIGGTNRVGPNQVKDVYISYSDVIISGTAGGIGKISINNLCIGIIPDSPDSSQQNIDASASLHFWCPKSKAPSDIAIGDEWPRTLEFGGGSSPDAEKAWRDALIAIFPRAGSNFADTNASINKELATEANTGAVGSFEISEQQIDTIAGWFHNSFVFQWFSMFVLMFVLLFFIKKGMA